MAYNLNINLTGRKIHKWTVIWECKCKEAWDIFEKQKAKCKLTGLPISFNDKTASLAMFIAWDEYKELTTLKLADGAGI